MRGMKKVNYGLITALALVLCVLTYVIVATAINYYDESGIRDVAVAFGKKVMETENNLIVDYFLSDGDNVKKYKSEIIKAHDEDLKEFYVKDFGTMAVSSLSAGDWNVVEFEDTTVSVVFNGFTKAEVGVSFRKGGYSHIEMTLEMVKVDGKWLIERWEYGGNGGYDPFDSLF